MNYEQDKDRLYKGIILIAIVLALFALSGSGGVSTIINNFYNFTNNTGTNLTNESVRPYNVSVLNLSGKIPYTNLNVSLCNPANQASSFNQATFNFDCVSIADSDNFEPPISAGTVLQYWRGDKTFQDFNNSVNNSPLANRVLNIEINLSNVTMITANGSIVASNLPDGFGNITNVSVSGGLIATYI